MSSSYVLLPNLKASRCSNTAEVRLLRSWEARNINKSGDNDGDKDIYGNNEDIELNNWNTKFVKVDQLTLFDLILVDYLNITGILNLTCKTVAVMIVGKTPEEMTSTSRTTTRLRKKLRFAKET